MNFCGVPVGRMSASSSDRSEVHPGIVLHMRAGWTKPMLVRNLGWHQKQRTEGEEPQGGKAVEKKTPGQATNNQRACCRGRTGPFLTVFPPGTCSHLSSGGLGTWSPSFHSCVPYGWSYAHTPSVSARIATGRTLGWVELQVNAQVRRQVTHIGNGTSKLQRGNRF